ncbi:MAG: LacI family DNA-binding transcriptional regulator [Caldilineaceae bacterium]|nr:LacI family DNA-binding transcriptional regulator [Caldilineaceae bacterium]
MSKKSVQTIDDIARLAKVSKSTVSRALNNSPLIRQETKERIWAIAREHKFRINVPARNLSLRQSRTIAFVIPDMQSCTPCPDSQFGLELLGGAADGLRALDYDLLIVHIQQRDSDWMYSYFDSGRVDGFVLMTEGREQSHIKKLIDLKAPFITWGVPLPNYSYCTVTGDNFTGGMLATDHLLQIGRQTIAFLGGPMLDMSVQQRLKGYQSALRAAGRSIEPELIRHGDDYTYGSGMTAMQRLLEIRPDVDAVFANSDLMALGALKAAKDQGKRVPDDIAVVGYDDVLIAAYNTLPLTTIRQNISMAGKLLAQNLVQYIQTGVVTNVTMPVELVIRESA